MHAGGLPHLSGVGWLKTWLDAGLSFFYPEVCQLCGEAPARPDAGYVCEKCSAQAKPILAPYCERCGLPFLGELTTPFECGNCHQVELHFDWARSSVAAEGVVLEAIHRYKYEAAPWFEPFLAKLLVQTAAPALQEGNWDMIVPVPLHPLKKAERQFNQAERLARHLAVALDRPVAPRLLCRVRATETQTQLPRRQRTANVHGAFALAKAVDLQGRRIVLVDDVLTTGATTNACARILKKAGAMDVCVWTVARGLLS